VQRDRRWRVKFYDDCPVCGRRIVARSVEALRHLMFEHVPACSDRAEDVRRALRDAALNREQLELFPRGDA